MGPGFSFQIEKVTYVAIMMWKKYMSISLQVKLQHGKNLTVNQQHSPKNSYAFINPLKSSGLEGCNCLGLHCKLLMYFLRAHNISFQYVSDATLWMIISE